MPYDPKVFVEGVDAVQEPRACCRRATAGCRSCVVLDLDDAATTHRVEFPEPAYDVRLARNPEFDTPTLPLHLHVARHARTRVYDYDLATSEPQAAQADGGARRLRPGDYVTERVFATATDGTKVPISLVYKKGLKRDGTAPCLLYGYGSYGLDDADGRSTRCG